MNTWMPQEYKIVPLRDCPISEKPPGSTPELIDQYWRAHIATDTHFNHDAECFAVVFLDTRHRVKGHQIIAIGILDSVLVAPREVFRAAIMLASAAIVLTHNHPSGDPEPSQPDVKVTQTLIRAGE